MVGSRKARMAFEIGHQHYHLPLKGNSTDKGAVRRFTRQERGRGNPIHVEAKGYA